MKFERGTHISEHAESVKGTLDDVYLIPAHREWGHLLYTLYKTVQLVDAKRPERKHGIVVVLNHAPGVGEHAQEVAREHARLYTLVASLNSPSMHARPHTHKEAQMMERGGKRFDTMVRTIQRAGVPIIPVYCIADGMSVAVARHVAGAVGRPLLKTDDGLLHTLDAETIPDAQSLARVRDAFARFPIDVAALQVLYDMHSMRAHEYAPYMNSAHATYLHDITRTIDAWKSRIDEGIFEEEIADPTLGNIIQTPGAGTVITGRAYDMLGGWRPVPDLQIGEDVDIGHRATRLGLNVIDFDDPFKKTDGSEEYIPAIHFTTPRSDGRADGQGKQFSAFATQTDTDFGDLHIQSDVGIRLQRELHRILALYDDGWGDVTEHLPADVARDLQRLNLRPEQFAPLWKSSAAWDGVRHTQEHHDIVVGIRALAEAHEKVSIREYVARAEVACRDLQAAIMETKIFGERFDFLSICSEWDYDLFVDSTLRMVDFLTRDLPPSHKTEEFRLKHMITIMHEYVMTVRHAHVRAVSTYTLIVSDQARLEQGKVPNTKEHRDAAVRRAQERVLELQKVREVYFSNALMNVSQKIFDAHFYSAAQSAPQRIWDIWKSTFIGVTKAEAEHTGSSE